MVTRKTPAKKPIEKKAPAKKTVAKAPVKKPVAKKPVAVKKPVAKKPAAPKTKAAVPKLTIKGKSPKELATKAGEPWVNIMSVELDPTNIGNGAFELDWNDIFLAKLLKAGYQGKTDADVVDNWFQSICRNILAENYEQWEANQNEEMRPRVIDRRDLGGGKTEVS